MNKNNKKKEEEKKNHAKFLCHASTHHISMYTAHYINLPIQYCTHGLIYDM